MSAWMKEVVLSLGTLLLLLLLAFINLGTLPIRAWDESRLAVSAYEMYRDGFSIVTTFEGYPDLWNTKPPLLIWLQATLMHLIGPTELAVRIPTAISVVVTCMSFLYVSKQVTQKLYLGIFAAFVLITTQGFNGIHTGRTGDYDAMLTLFTTLAAWSVFFAAEHNFRNHKWNLAIFVFLTLGVLTKSISPLMFGPGFLIFLLWQKKLSMVLKSRTFYAGLGTFLIVALGYYFLREWAEPGYLKAVWNNDLFGRFGSTIENHKNSFSYYFENLIDHQFTYHLIYLLPGALIAWLSPHEQTKRLAGFSIILFLSYYLVISSSQTKLHWYDCPAFPFAAMLVGLFFWRIHQILITFFTQRNAETLVFLILFSLFSLPPYVYFLDQNYKPKEHPDYYDYYYLTYMLKEASRNNVDLSGYTFIKDTYQAHNFFYIQKMIDRGEDYTFVHSNAIRPGDKVIVDEQLGFNFVLNKTEHELLWEGNDGKVKAYLIKSTKE
jgi:4-amino-4-deoxy-L-arabinose transferase-like glycosyltransferase